MIGDTAWYVQLPGRHGSGDHSNCSRDLNTNSLAMTTATDPNMVMADTLQRDVPQLRYSPLSLVVL